jgi:hypothetical protein
VHRGGWKPVCLGLADNFLSLKMVDCQGMRQVAKPNMKFTVPFVFFFLQQPRILITLMVLNIVRPLPSCLDRDIAALTSLLNLTAKERVLVVYLPVSLLVTAELAKTVGILHSLSLGFTHSRVTMTVRSFPQSNLRYTPHL